MKYEIGYNTIKPLHSKFAAIHNIPFLLAKLLYLVLLAHSTFTLNLLKNYILPLNWSMIFYMKTFHGNGQMNMNVFFKNKECLSLLKQNLHYQIQNTHFYHS